MFGWLQSRAVLGLLYLLMIAGIVLAIGGVYHAGFKSGQERKQVEQQARELQATQKALSDLLQDMKAGSEAGERLVADLSTLRDRQVNVGKDLREHLAQLRQEKRNEGDPPRLHECVLDDRTVGLLNEAREASRADAPVSPSGSDGQSQADSAPQAGNQRR